MSARCCHICIRLPVLIHRSACGVFVRGHEEYGASCSVEQQLDFLVGRDTGRPVTLKGNNDSDQKDETRSEIFLRNGFLFGSFWMWGLEAWAPEACWFLKCPCPTLDSWRMERAWGLG